MANSVRKTASTPKAAAKTRKPATKSTVHAKGNGTSAPNGNGTLVSHDQVAQLAHHFFVERGCEHGHDAEDWRRAEQEIRARAS